MICPGILLFYDRWFDLGMLKNGDNFVMGMTARKVHCSLFCLEFVDSRRHNFFGDWLIAFAVQPFLPFSA